MNVMLDGMGTNGEKERRGRRRRRNRFSLTFSCSVQNGKKAKWHIFAKIAPTLYCTQYCRALIGWNKVDFCLKPNFEKKLLIMIYFFRKK